MITNAPPGAEPIAQMKGTQKAAILLIMLGDEASAEIIKHLSEDDVQLVTREIARMKKIQPEQGEAVLEEFYTMTSAKTYVVSGGMDYAKSVLINAFGPEAGRKMLDRVVKAMGADMANFDAVQKADPQQLAKFLQLEHPQTIALVLAHLSPSQAAALLAQLPQAQRADLAVRVASLDQISPEVIVKIATVTDQLLILIRLSLGRCVGGCRLQRLPFTLDRGDGKVLQTGIPERFVGESNLCPEVRICRLKSTNEAVDCLLCRTGSRAIPLRRQT